ncbi:site-specific DNA-methyltransferase [Chromatium okenii]|uniref:site-specific DNA-methyltransferase n=1 Tax=Chromatium okenii TaxID=61644 RepID=UPI001903D141|nr:site-specific DNA-methyltransferase [Chromatium okenii]MBK1641281.1 site-specific DNA-methyltransferase [Chromatium okenii]
MPLLDWINKEHAKTSVREVPFHLLNEVATYGAAADNLLIQGDNLLALKALIPFYAGRVKCIFIDPPYNTQSAFEHYDDKLEHSAWLSMIYPRLVLLRDLLSEDGSIWVSIDDNEAHYLKVLMDEIFGRRNFVTSFIWKKSYGGGAKSKHFVGLHEYLICYTKQIDLFPEMWLPPDPDAVKKYYKYSDENYLVRGPYRLQPLATTSMDDRPNLKYPVIHPDGREIWPEKQWQWSRERVIQAQLNNEILITEKAGKFTVSYKQYLRDQEGKERHRKPQSIIEGHYTQHGTFESTELFGLANKFSFPKPEGLVNTILEACTNVQDIVLDSFLGSGTTAAVAHKMNRRWIGIELGDHARSHCIPRLEKVIAGEAGGISGAVNWTGGGGFRFCTLGAAVFHSQGELNPAVDFATLAAYIWHLETGTPAPASFTNPLLGIHNGVAYYLLYKDILGALRSAEGNLLTAAVLDWLKSLATHDGACVIYGDLTRLGATRLAAERIVFKQLPYDVTGR